MGTIILPTEKKLGGAKFNQLKWLLYGSSGIGKTTFFSKMDEGDRSPLFLATDPGQRFINTMTVPITTWGQFLDVTDILTTKSCEKYSIIVLDTVDILFRICRKFICDREGVSHVSEMDWGRGTDLVRDAFELTIAKLALLDHKGTGLGFISHSKDIEVRGRAVKTSKVVPTMQNAAYGIVAPLCDLIGYCGFTQEKVTKENPDGIGRAIHFAPDETYDAKDRTGMLPAKCKLDFDVVRRYLEEGGIEEGSGEEVEEQAEEVTTTRTAAPKKKKRKA